MSEPKKHISRLKITIAYDGGAYKGWQSQKNGDTVQDRIETAFQKLTGREIRAHGSGRTDTGVHALGQVAHAQVDTDRFEPWQWRDGLNAHMPPDIRVIRARAVPETFHARYSAKGKIYRYDIWNHRILHPMQLGRVWHVKQPLNLDLLEKNAQLFVGEHDFGAFAANRGYPEKTTVRTIYSVTLTSRGPRVRLTFHGNGFMYHMVRLITGQLVRSVMANADPEEIPRKLRRGAAEKAQHACPAQGLYLVRVIY
jgi:tRNA pseudouridine38-40 synthase